MIFESKFSGEPEEVTVWLAPSLFTHSTVKFRGIDATDGLSSQVPLDAEVIVMLYDGTSRSLDNIGGSAVVTCTGKLAL
jgi:hypothetical protein